MKRFGAIVIALVCLMVIGLSVVAFFSSAKREKLKTGFAVLQMGDPKEKVVEVLGQPEEVENCYDVDQNVEPDKRCSQIYWYKPFLERWGVSLNKDGIVVHKTYNVLY